MMRILIPSEKLRIDNLEQILILPLYVILDLTSWVGRIIDIVTAGTLTDLVGQGEYYSASVVLHHVRQIVTLVL
jgi:hypothetical protein